MTDSFNRVTCPKCGYEENTLSAKRCEICGQALKKNNPIPLIGASVITLALLGGGGYLGYQWFVSKQTSASVTAASINSSGSQSTTLPATRTTDPQLVDQGAASGLMSWGERILFTDAPNGNMQAATQSFASGDYATAISQLEVVRKAVRNDPEALIYLNNARIGDGQAIGIAAVVPISDTPNAARELLRGVAQAQDEAIRSGVPVKVMIADDGNNPDKAVAIANALVQESNIIAVIGHGTSRTTLAAAPIYQQNQLPIIAPTSTTTEIAQISRSGSNFIFRVIPSDQFTGTSLARYMLSSGQNKPIIFYNSQSSYSKSLQEAFATTVGLEGGQIVKVVDLSQGNSTAELQGSGADALVLFPDSETLDQGIAVAQINKGQLPTFAGDAVYRIETLQKGGSALNNMVIAVPWHPQKANAPFVQTSTSLWGGDINWRTALSYDAFQAIRTARSASNVTPQMGVQGRSELQKALAGQGFTANGSTGAITFLPSGDRNSTVLLVKVQPGSRSGTGLDFVPFQ